MNKPKFTPKKDAVVIVVVTISMVLILGPNKPVLVAIYIILAGLGVVIHYVAQMLIPARYRRRAINLYFHIPRLLLPDSIYRLWYRTGIMDADAYRSFQERGYINDETDPEYLQRYE